jgi:N-acetylglucosaminyldiphosphoundecaprenol N-acetyl-beta-D-mannosaminyltransferase
MIARPHVSVGGLRVATASRAELVRSMVEDIRARRGRAARGPPRLAFDSNGHAISLAASDPSYRRAMDEADLIHADGGFVVLASKWLAGERIAERSATTDLIHDVARAAEREGLSFYLLGGTEEVNAQCAQLLAELYPKLGIVGRRHGYFSEADEEQVLADIARADPDMVWIGLGKPREQIFAARHRDRLGAAWIVTCGGCFNYVTGHYRRAPRWMQRLNLEWLHRAFTDRKLARRYATTSPHAIWLALTRIDRRRYPSARKAPR